ncbi:hypothetical protein Tco_0650063 [Tanacetum coccineum]
MDGLDVCSKHNMVAYLEKNEGNTEFHQVMDFLTNSSIYYALTVSLIISTSFVEQFWTSAKSRTVNNVSYIDAIAIFDAIKLMGYDGDLTVLTFNKALFSPQWKFLFHTMNHCISSKSTYWDQIPTNIATAVICLTTNQKYNFSKLVFDGMRRHLDAYKKFVMYPRFLQIFLDNQLKDVPVLKDHFPLPALTKKVLTFMVKKSNKFSGKVTPLFDSMLVTPTQDEGQVLERQSEPHPIPSPTHLSKDHYELQPHQSPRPSSPTPIPDSNPASTGGNHGGQSSSDKSLSGNEDGLTLQSIYDICVSLCQQAWLKAVRLKQQRKGMDMGLSKKRRRVSKQGRSAVKSSKGAPSVQSNTDWDGLDAELDTKLDDGIDYTLTEGQSTDLGQGTDKVDQGTDKVNQGTDKEDQGTDKVNQGTDKENQSTDKVNESTDHGNESTVKQKEGTGSSRQGTDATSTAQTTNSDDETIAQLLVTMSQKRLKLKEMEKGVELRDAEEIEKPRPTSTRSVLTLKPLPKIDPKDKGKKRIENDESDTELEDITTAEKKFKQLANDEEMAKKIQEEWEAEEERKRLAEEEAIKDALIRNYDDIKARIEADRLLAERL